MNTHTDTHASEPLVCAEPACVTRKDKHDLQLAFLCARLHKDVALRSDDTLTMWRSLACLTGRVCEEGGL